MFLKEASCGDGRTEVEGSALESGLHIAAAYFLFETSRHPNIYFFDEDATKDEDVARVLSIQAREETTAGN